MMNPILKAAFFGSVFLLLAIGSLCFALMFFGGQAFYLSGMWLLCWIGSFVFLYFRQKRKKATNAGDGFCDKHKPGKGARNCLVCGCHKLTGAISQIDYALGEPNEMGLSSYDTHADENLVVARVQSLVEQLRIARAALDDSAPNKKNKEGTIQ